MTEAEWRACRTSAKLLAFLHGRLTERKWRLIGSGCCRIERDRIRLAECRQAMDVAERMADGEASDDEIAAGFRAASYARDMATGTIAGIPRRYKVKANRRAAWALYELLSVTDRKSPDFLGYLQIAVADALDYLAEIDDHFSANRRRQADVIREIVGNPFRPATCDPDWRTSTVLALARGIYDERAFDRLPILADALQDAGCDDEQVLTHCRGPGPHVRGCWVVDLLLGKG